MRVGDSVRRLQPSRMRIEDETLLGQHICIQEELTDRAIFLAAQRPGAGIVATIADRHAVMGLGVVAARCLDSRNDRERRRIRLDAPSLSVIDSGLHVTIRVGLGVSPGALPEGRTAARTRRGTTMVKGSPTERTARFGVPGSETGRARHRRDRRRPAVLRHRGVLMSIAPTAAPSETGPERGEGTWARSHALDPFRQAESRDRSFPEEDRSSLCAHPGSTITRGH